MKLENKNIVLIGFMGSGKTSTSKSLSQMLSREYLSTDEQIISLEKRSIPEIFEESGEDYFREVEARVVRAVSSREKLIIDCGGGVVKNPENIRQLKKGGILVYLETSVEWVYRRVKDDTNRPLLQVDDPRAKIQALLDERKEVYSQADISVLTDAKTADEVAEDIIQKLSSSGLGPGSSSGFPPSRE